MLISVTLSAVEGQFFKTMQDKIKILEDKLAQAYLG
jgi:hypothetical protein